MTTNRKTYRVIGWGIGGVGAELLTSVLDNPAYELLGLRVYNPDKDGRDVGELLGGEPIGITATTDTDKLLGVEADCVLYAASDWYDHQQVIADLCRILASGRDVLDVTMTPLAYPSVLPEVAKLLEDACQEGGSSFYYGGINPGFAIDLLPALVTSGVRDVESVEVTEYFDVSTYMDAMLLEKLGFGLTPEQYEEQVEVAVMASLWSPSPRLIADAIAGVELDDMQVVGKDLRLADDAYDVRTLRVGKGTVEAFHITLNFLVNGTTRIVYHEFLRVSPDSGAPWQADWPPPPGWLRQLPDQGQRGADRRGGPVVRPGRPGHPALARRRGPRRCVDLHRGPGGERHPDGPRRAARGVHADHPEPRCLRLGRVVTLVPGPGTGSREWVLGDGWVIGDDPLHQDCAAPIRWTTVNLAEAFPGVPTPLTWTVVGPVFEAMARGGWVMIGAIPRAKASIPARVEDRYMTIFHGRPVFSLDAWRMLGDSMPGTSGDAVETQIFGAKASAAESGPRWRRYPVVAVKMPVAARRSRLAMLGFAETTDRWWRSAVSDDSVSGSAEGGRDRSELLALLCDAQRRIITIGSHHTVLSMLAFAAYEQVRLLAAAAGLPGLETELLGGDGAEESKTVEDLWALSRDRLSRAEFLDRHGFHGPAEGELATPSWRQRDTPLESVLATYRKLDDDASPAAGRADRLAVRKAAELRLLGALGPARRARARLLFAMAHRYLPLRELGRCTFLKAIDVARHAAFGIGTELARDGLLGQPEDVFQLCLHELDEPPADLPDLVAGRRARHAGYGATELPDIFTGSPTPTPIAASGTGETVTGLGVSSGVVQGHARVIRELGEDEIEAGEILVCQTTAPGWASYFFVAGGVVIDVGGPISHGAIVARELGIPCVINTRNGTQRIGTGDLIRVDGTAGTVDVLQGAP